jgi:Ca2+-binding EF-hand superfamily protein
MEAAEQEINDMIDEVWAKYDVDKNGYLDKIETKKFVLDTLGKFEARTQFSDEMFEEVFKMFDKNNSGTVEKAEMATFIKQLAGIDMDDNYEDDENGG